MSTGKINTWNSERGFGFLRTDDGDRIFFHISAWQGDQEDIEQGATVQFKMSNDRNGRPCAINVRPVDAAAAALFADR
jgi:cold shock CspA family protein